MNIFKNYFKHYGELLIVMLIVSTLVELLFPIFKLDSNSWRDIFLGAVLPIVAITIIYDIVRKRYRKHKKKEE